MGYGRWVKKWQQNTGHWFSVGGVALVLVGCGGVMPPSLTRAPVNACSRPYAITNSFYQGRWFVPQAHYELCQEGEASFYGLGDKTHGCLTATGMVFDSQGMTAAHRTLPLPCVVQVDNLDNGCQVRLMVNDRGPFAKERILDVSARAADVLGLMGKGTARVRVTTIVQDSVQLGRAYMAWLAAKKAALRRGQRCQAFEDFSPAYVQAFLSPLKDGSKDRQSFVLQTTRGHNTEMPKADIPDTMNAKPSRIEQVLARMQVARNQPES